MEVRKFGMKYFHWENEIQNEYNSISFIFDEYDGLSSFRWSIQHLTWIRKLEKKIEYICKRKLCFWFSEMYG